MPIVTAYMMRQKESLLKISFLNLTMAATLFLVKPENWLLRH